MNKIAGRAGQDVGKKITGQGRIRLPKYEQGRLQVAKIAYPAALYSRCNIFEKKVSHRNHCQKSLIVHYLLTDLPEVAHRNLKQGLFVTLFQRY